MGFDETKKDKISLKPISEMTYQELDAALTSLSQVSIFNASDCSSRMQKNYRCLAHWAAMSVENYKAEKAFAKHAGKTIEVWSQAHSEDGAIRIPVNDAGYPMNPSLIHVIGMQEERLSRVAYAKKKEVEAFESNSTFE